MILYHITPRRNLTSILQKGILPGYCQGLTCSPEYKWKNVFLTNDVNRILTTQASAQWISKHDPIVLEVEIDDANVEPHKYWSNGTYTLSDFEFTTTKIEPNKIIKYYEWTNN